MLNIFKRRRLLILTVLGLIFLIISVYLIVSLAAVSAAEMTLAELKNSWEVEKICHEQCIKTRQEMTETLIDDLKNKPDSRAGKLLRTYFLAEENDADFRRELLRIISAVYGANNPPDYIRAYLRLPSGNVKIQAEIINLFSPRFLNASFSGSPLDYYFMILAGNSALDLKLASLRALGGDSDKGANFSVSQLIIIKKIVLNNLIDHRLRQPLVLLLSDYYPFFPAETAAILQAIYQDEASGDTISRVFAGDILNHQGGTELDLPEISSAQWEEYYNE